MGNSRAVRYAAALALIALAPSSAIAADWVTLAEWRNGTKIEADRETMEVFPGGRILVWVRMTLPAPERVRRAIYRTTFDCARRTSEVQYSALYGADGNMIGSPTRPLYPTSQPIIPDSYEDMARARVCPVSPPAPQ